MRNTLTLAVLISATIAASGVSSAGATSEACDPTILMGAAEWHDTFNRQAVEAIERAGNPGWESDSRLAQLVAPDANFTLGMGDISNAVSGEGLSGARSMAEALMADAFRFDDWNYMNRPIDGCSRRQVEIEFIDTAGKRRAVVEFDVRDGVIQAGKGWIGAFTEGVIPSAMHR